MSYSRDNRSPDPLNETVSRVMSANKSQNTKPELLIRKALWQSGLRGYRLHWKKAPGRPDICYPGRKVAIFINGCYWHRCPHCKLPLPKTNTAFWKAKFERNVIRDKEKEEMLINSGWRVLVFWECEIKNDLERCIEQVQNVNDI